LYCYRAPTNDVPKQLLSEMINKTDYNIEENKVCAWNKSATFK
jgi:hypothetical protein